MTKTEIHNKLGRQIIAKLRATCTAHNFSTSEINVLFESIIAGLFYAMMVGHPKPWELFGKITERLHDKLQQHLVEKGRPLA